MPSKDPMFVGQVVARSDGDVLINADGELVGAFASTGVQLDNTNTTDPTSDGQMVYVNGTGYRFRAEGSVFTVPTSGGGGGGTGLDEAYSINANVTVDEGASTWTDATSGALNTIELVKSGAGSGNVLDLSIDAALTGDAVAIDMNLGIAARGIFIDNGATARTGADIQVNDDSTGNHSVIDINSSGSGASVGLDWVGSFNGSPGGSAVSITMDNTDNLDTEGVLVTRGTGVRTASALSIVDTSTGSDDLINIDIGGVFTGDAIDITTTAAATGNAIFIDLDSAVAMTALHIEGSGVRTQPYIELITDSTSSASLVDISVDGAVTGAAAIDIDLNAGVACAAIFIDAGNAVRTADVIDCTFDGSGNVSFLDVNNSNTGSGNLIDIATSGIHTGNTINIVQSAAATGDVINIDMDASVAGSALVVDAGGGTRTDDLFKVTFDGDGVLPCWDIDISATGANANVDYWNIVVSDVLVGSILDVTYSAAATGDCIDLDMTSAVAAKAMIITGAGARTDDIFEVNDSSTSNAHGMDWNISGINTGNCLDITYSASAATGNAINIATGTNLAGNAIAVTTAGVRTAPVILVTGAATDGGTDDHVLFINQSGLLDSNLAQLTFGTAASTGNALGIAMDTNVAGMAVDITSAGTGVNNEGSCINVSHSGDLVTGATVMRVDSTGNYANASGNMVEFIQRTGAGQTGNNAVYISATGANVEALRVDDGTVTIDETLTVTAGYAGTHIGATITSTTGADAVAITGTLHEVTTTGTGDALTLANGTAGQRLKVIYVAEGAGADTAVITPTTLAGGSTITLNALGDSCDLVYSSTGGWYVLGLGGAAAVA